MCGGRRPAFRRTSPSRCLSAAVVLAVLGTSAVEGVPIPLPLTLPGRPGIDGKLDGPGAVVCYNFTLSDEAVREVVWWEKGRLALRLEPCVGKPHLRASVYGCPSEGARSVWEYMSPKMRADLAAQGKHVPADWEWIGDVETLVLEVTHRTYFIEVLHESEPYTSIDGQSSVAKFRLEAHLLDLAGMPLESINPLKAACGWDRELRVRPREVFVSNALGGFVTALTENQSKTQLEWYPPGQGGAPVDAAKCPWAANISGTFSYQVYVREITNFVGTSGVDYDRALKARQNTNWLFPPGDFVDVIKPPVCPVVYQDGSGQCTSGTCRMCPIDFPDCPKEFLTNCTEVAVNLEKIKNTLNGTTRPLESYVKNAARYTAWTSCGLLSTSDRVSANRKVERRPSDADGGWASMPDSLSPGGADGTWWQPEDLELDPGTGRLSLLLQGLEEGRNNVYVINVVVRDDATGERAPYKFLTLQMRTAKYEPPELSGGAIGLLVGLSVGLVILIAIFAGTATFVHRKRMAKQAQRPRPMKK